MKDKNRLLFLGSSIYKTVVRWNRKKNNIFGGLDYEWQDALLFFFHKKLEQFWTWEKLYILLLHEKNSSIFPECSNMVWIFVVSYKWHTVEMLPFFFFHARILLRHSKLMLYHFFYFCSESNGDCCGEVNGFITQIVVIVWGIEMHEIIVKREDLTILG